MNQAHCKQTSVPMAPLAPLETLTSLAELTIERLSRANEIATFHAVALGEETVGEFPQFPNYSGDKPSLQHLLIHINNLSARLIAQLEVAQKIV